MAAFHSEPLYPAPLRALALNQSPGCLGTGDGYWCTNHTSLAERVGLKLEHYQNYLEGLFTHRLPTPRVSAAIGLGWGQEFAFLASSPVVLIWNHYHAPPWKCLASVAQVSQLRTQLPLPLQESQKCWCLRWGFCTQSSRIISLCFLWILSSSFIQLGPKLRKAFPPEAAHPLECSLAPCSVRHWPEAERGWERCEEQDWGPLSSLSLPTVHPTTPFRNVSSWALLT